MIPKFVRSAIFKGTYETHELKLIEKILLRGDRVLEIGTGVGVVSAAATKLCGEGMVFSYEANERLESVIRCNYELNGWSPNLVMKAVTSDGRDIQLYRDENIVSSSLYDRGLELEENLVKSVALPEVFESVQPDVLIMDVEGAEDELLPLKCVSSVREIVVEMHPHIIGQDKVDMLSNRLINNGFHLKESLHKTSHFGR